MACDDATEELLAEHRRRYAVALARARTWFDGLRIDPGELRAHGIKGKKKLTELLSAYYRLWKVAPSSEKPSLQKRIEEIVAVTYEPHYHDLATIGDRQLREDATSYFLTAVLMEKVGLDTELYRREIRKAQPRIDAHLARRGPNQRAVFHTYYRHFGLKEPFSLASALDDGYIARRVDPDALAPMEIYQVTHEIFAPYEYGDRLDADPFDEDTKRYLRSTLERLIDRAIERRDPDLVAELVSCMRYLRFVDSARYRTALLYLLDSQNPDGSWGDHDRARRLMGSYAVPGILLHTTLVAVDALTIAFHHSGHSPENSACR